jgi:hypothetical protein
MGITPKALVTPQQIANATTTYYTSTGLRTRIDKLTVTNPTAGAATVTIYLVPSGGSAGDSTTISKTKSVASLETWNCPDVVGHILEAGGTLQAVASAATTLTLAVSGAQLS